MTDHPAPIGRVSPFEMSRKTTNDGGEYWSARDLQAILEYEDFRNLETAIQKAMIACERSGQAAKDHFVETTKMVDLGSGSQRQIKDYHLSRYACYLLIQNADPSKPMVALGQTYFAVQTRKQEVFEQASEEEKRMMLRQEMRQHNKHLASAAKRAGVQSSLDFAIFQNHGYRGLYGGLEKRDIQRRKGLKESQDILDHMGSTELAANLFRATQTEEKLRRDNVANREEANRVHYHVGRKVRETIKELGGTMPEDLPPAEDIKKIERKRARELKAKNANDGSNDTD